MTKKECDTLNTSTSGMATLILLAVHFFKLQGQLQWSTSSKLLPPYVLKKAGVVAAQFSSKKMRGVKSQQHFP
eukprot:423973-Amphidinium_carterae.2